MQTEMKHNDCAGCETCVFSEPQTELIYEIHITVDNDKYFIETCYEFGVKPVIVENGNNVSTHVMTSSTHRGNDASAMSYMAQLAEMFTDRGFNVIRKKIETVPWHPCGENPQPNQYFETHFSVRLSKPHHDLKVLDLKELATYYDLHFSQNILKNGSVQMLTYRRFNVTSKLFLKQVKILESHFRRRGHVLDKVITEFALYDSNTSLDNEWLEGNKNVSNML